MSEAERLRANARAYANVYQRRGKLVSRPCEWCAGTDHLEKHHPDYTQPLLVVWLCRGCHKAFHASVYNLWATCWEQGSLPDTLT